MNKVQSYVFSWDQVEQATFLNICPVYHLQNSWNIESSGNNGHKMFWSCMLRNVQDTVSWDQNCLVTNLWCYAEERTT